MQAKFATMSQPLEGPCVDHMVNLLNYYGNVILLSDSL